ncbi:guanitoxin biosynthesis heme-dependent pre-guanitoxin N-hydroxylase GntA [Bdellovibrio sp. KM01]|uniref:guanitoxin biosynthesis heme-dependent pre-guanitoxin N-hydroxylase GntA n=1 Tax=Bdellovibrio sp. KM01 TaxID=2748865 RepID=UPI0015E98D69|nr:guanitoxin biosynthesis heme-dependent pre-guanitoxin N-hydroxylase GntA [Bdellovibrio sp. KM01]QLY26391.1 YqcI/YcgG family protein [Bdellovibrio sp. KM01]
MTDETTLTEFEKEISDLVFKENYPCIAALKTLSTGQCRMGMFGVLGAGDQSARLAADLLALRDEQKKTGSLELSYFAVFPDLIDMDEEDFERRLWKELSHLTEVPHIDQSWDTAFSDNPEDKNFCFSLGGTAFFVVGMHQQSSRLSRRIRYPTLVFNVYEQFKELDRRNRYQPMIQANRKRDILFQGDVNPMSEKYNDHWEAIQFSGRNNSADWVCPFHKGAGK